MSTASQKHAELKRVSKSVKDGLFAMLKLVDEILKDHEYVDQFGGEGPLIDKLEADEFSHFGGQPSLPQMLRAYRANPKQKTWKEYDFNIWAMIELAAPVKEGGETVKVNWKAKAKELEAELAIATASLDDTRKLNDELRQRIDGLIKDNGELRGRVKALEEFRTPAVA